jgi:biotin carboxyl carrier protein
VTEPQPTVARRGDGAARRDGAAARRPAASVADRSNDQRRADHAAIDRLADDLVPALIAKLAATGLGEIEVGEGDWTVRVRRPGDPARHDRRSTDRASRAQPGHGSVHAGHAAGFEGHRSSRDPRPASGPSSNGVVPGAGPSGGPLDAELDAHRAVATSPAVGIFQPRNEARTGTRVRSGDRLGAVDMLGVPQEVIAPADGIVGATLVEAGEAVEYGQELVVIELAGRAADGPAHGAVSGPGADGGSVGADA